MFKDASTVIGITDYSPAAGISPYEQPHNNPIDRIQYVSELDVLVALERNSGVVHLYDAEDCSILARLRGHRGVPIAAEYIHRLPPFPNPHYNERDETVNLAGIPSQEDEGVSEGLDTALLDDDDLGGGGGGGGDEKYKPKPKEEKVGGLLTCCADMTMALPGHDTKY